MNNVDFIDPILDNTLAVNMPVRDSDDYTKKRSVWHVVDKEF